MSSVDKGAVKEVVIRKLKYSNRCCDRVKGVVGVLN